MADEEVLAGGGVNHVVRAGETVRRPTGPWTPAVHALLGHLAARGFAGAPRSHGIDGKGREILDFVPGRTADYPLPGWARSDDALVAAGELLRRYHDATAGFEAPPGAEWYFPAVSPAEVICHGDVATYNCVFREGLPVAFIDFDTAHPGPRVWDVAYAAYRFVPLTDPQHADGRPVGEQTRRLSLFAGAYALGEEDCGALVETARARLEHLVRHMHERAAAGDEAFAGHVARGDDVLYECDVAHLTRHEAVLRRALTCRSPRSGH
ncbi:aminoglycoside phosphotransferase family protein [Nonomuraea mesophila]|uniref:Aminoglycoside phosphotransferase family protein n=1 Tax=Nonomuraea mesophila TaxID=2530382 RepID=A0A4R5ECR3_9ACTN|nr:aminoglycoside phosphotransferase family protein [Nonomuraea mesophila]TDE31110.1 aminoglycoside phosphotransferase family protein [Nonomuraea mesophila]